MSFDCGNVLKLTVFGQSHSEAIGGVLSGLPCGYEIDLAELQAFADRRRATDELSTARREKDEIKILSGLFGGRTCGSPVAFEIKNGDVRSADYEKLVDCPRPSHADYTAKVKYGGFGDYRGGGHFSGRLTAPLCVAGGIAKQVLENFGIKIGAHVIRIKDAVSAPYDPVNPALGGETVTEEMKEIILSAKKSGDSVGGVIECSITGLPAGIGEPNFDGMESSISRLVFAVPAVKGIEFGNGFAAAELFGSENNDAFTLSNGKVVTKTNNSGGINGGITNGMPLLFRAAVKPTPSINKPQLTFDFASGEERELIIGGRHDPCVALRAVPAIESAAAIACLDMLLVGGKDKFNKR